MKILHQRLYTVCEEHMRTASSLVLGKPQTPEKHSAVFRFYFKDVKTSVVICVKFADNTIIFTDNFIKFAENTIIFTDNFIYNHNIHG